MFELIKNGGWMMFPIILCSIAAMAIIGERFWSLQRKRIIPPDLVPYIWQCIGTINSMTVQSAALNPARP